ANLVRKRASSMAESPPPTTTTFRSRKKKPSQVAQVETPRPTRALSLGSPRSLAEAPVATMSEWASYVSPRSVVTRNGRELRSHETALPGTYSAPNRAACWRMLFIRSGPMIPSGKPGKFSTRVVRVSWPPGSFPSMTSGLRLARAAYKAAVSPAGPEPRMMQLRTLTIKGHLRRDVGPLGNVFAGGTSDPVLPPAAFPGRCRHKILRNRADYTEGHGGWYGEPSVYSAPCHGRRSSPWRSPSASLRCFARWWATRAR